MGDYKNPKTGETYISPSLVAFGNSDKRVRIITKQIDSPDSYAFAKVREELVLRHREDAKSKITIKFVEDSRKIFILSIQGYTVATEKPHNASFTFVGEEIDELLNFANNIKRLKLDNRSGMTISDEEIAELSLTNNQIKQIINMNEDAVIEILKNDITKEDLISIGYRKKQIEVFKKLLSDEEYFTSLMEKKGCTNEGLWQKYFEKNKWIFGYGLNYLFLSSFDKDKLEKTVQGFSINSYGKRVDALMRTKGIISNLCFIEIKTQKTKLLANKSYRSGCWAPSTELAGAVAQIQGTVYAAVENLTGKIRMIEENGEPTGEEIYNYHPKSYLIIGNLTEFMCENGINEDKYKSFENFRKNLINPEIITFDELYERARFIINIEA